MKTLTQNDCTEAVPFHELERRRKSCLARLARQHPDATGMLLFSAVNIFYLTGFMGSGVFWLPREGSALLLLRKGADRARRDSPHTPVAALHSFLELGVLAEERGIPLSGKIGAEMSGLPWHLADELRAGLPRAGFVPGEGILAQCRAVKSPWELSKLREAGRRHARALEELLPQSIAVGMTEQEVAARLFAVCLELGNCGISRMANFGQEMLLGEVSVGDNGNRPTTYNGPLGFQGLHSSAPYMGSSNSAWQEKSLLAVDTVFCYEGYNTDKTLCYFAGAEKDIPKEALAAHAFCCEVEARIAGKLKPGALPSALYGLSLAMAEEAGFSRGFMGVGGNKVPFLGHSIGFCVDESPVLAKGFDEPLEEGMVFALEPKVGIPGFGMVGTENTWEVTASGAVCLTGGPRRIRCLI